jgi:hypothetical protein
MGPTVTGTGREDGGGRGKPRTTAASPAWSKSDVMTGKVALGFRLSEVVLCLISFSVMAADKTQGWSGDSFDRYKEYRFSFLLFFSIFIYNFPYFVFNSSLFDYIQNKFNCNLKQKLPHVTIISKSSIFRIRLRNYL